MKNQTEGNNTTRMNSLFHRGFPCDVVANVLDCDIVVCEFELPSRSYNNFRINTISKDLNPT